MKPKTLKEALEKSLLEQKKYVPRFKNSIDEHLQHLMLPLFCMKFGKWDH